MSNRRAEELREYLRRPHSQSIPEFDDFLGQIDTLYRLRLKAEERFNYNQHVAKNRRGTLPLDWSEINDIINPNIAAPPETLITRISRECLTDAEEILGCLRKVLIREREKMSLGMVQQVDANCLRWLCRQPGYDAIEKAGAKQRILAIVRRENYNTLENRVFKDFLMRCNQETAQYLHKNQNRFPDHPTTKCLRRLHTLCKKGSTEPLLERVGIIRALPIPNYVLRQERRYTKIWKAYVELIRQANIAERLWVRQKEVKDTLARLRTELQKHINPQAKYHCPIWFNALDGKHSILDNPFYVNEVGVARIAKSNRRSEEIIIDLTGGTLRWDLLIYGQHDNARPYIQDYQKPSIEDLDKGCHYFLYDLISKQDINDKNLREHLRDYFLQLHSRLGGKHWFILVPDSWGPFWQENIIKSIPLARNNVFLLWRSVAAILGSADKLKNPRENDTVVVVDSQMNGVVSLSKLTLAANETGAELIPQRKSYNRHKECYSDEPLSIHIKADPKKAFLWGVKNEYMVDNKALGSIRRFIGSAHHVILVNCNILATPLKGIAVDGMALEKGVERFIEKQRQGQTAYYDEMEALSLIVQTADEQVMAKPLVEADEKFPGGKEKSIDEIRDAARLKQGFDYVNLLLCMGEASPDAPLKIKKHSFNASLSEDQSIHICARMKPGQGMAIATIESDFLSEPIELDFLSNMSDQDERNRSLTISIIENEMDRSFPPDSPHVVADYDLWISGNNGYQDIKHNVEKYLAGQIDPDGGWFAQASQLYPNYIPLPSGLSPLERLRRKNVFGNDPQKRLPLQPSNSIFQDNFNFGALFRRLANDYNRAQDKTAKDKLARLIAWTYQSEFAGFIPIRRQILKRVLGYARGTARQAPLFQELTLCANLCNRADEWSDCLEAVRLRISNYDKNVARDFYLLYNLLQFHPKIINDTGNANTTKCWQWVRHIPHWYEHYQNSPNAIGYILKSILYILRCRRFDGKVFLTQERDNVHYTIINRCLQQRVHFQHEKLRLLVIEYLNNKGTIDGLPVD